MTVKLSWVDAFTDQPFTGNPAAVCLLSEPLAEDHMQSLAFELGISETAYVSPGAGPNAFDLRWFSPTVEIDLCGHATLASAHTLRERGVVDGSTPVTFHTRSGALIAIFDGERIVLDFPADPMTPAPLPLALAGQWSPDLVVGAATTSFFSIVVLANEAAVRQYRPDLNALGAVDSKAILITAPAEPGSDADYVLRVFGPRVGISEDPATGSAQCSIGPYWSAAIGRPSLVAHQASPRGAVLYVRPDGDRVHIAGHAVTVISGRLC
ncbi:MAG TPA: PhzF family phenazine biosynthesis protein [Acidimicrobiales bacterium]|jgi:PhzF family phenazine biosynthesis protein|nr:PhzF family phenazine biosynthesis protein [Acidimicrobiales bacterium]